MSFIYSVGIREKIHVSAFAEGGDYIEEYKIPEGYYTSLTEAIFAFKNIQGKKEEKDIGNWGLWGMAYRTPYIEQFELTKKYEPVDLTKVVLHELAEMKRAEKDDYDGPMF